MKAGAEKLRLLCPQSNFRGGALIAFNFRLVGSKPLPAALAINARCGIYTLLISLMALSCSHGSETVSLFPLKLVRGQLP